MNKRKEVNLEGDLVLIHYQDSPALYARIEAIEPDVKKDWYQVTLLLLTIPCQTVTWILREEYINGSPFTMGGEPVRLEGIKKPSPKIEPEDLGSDVEKGPGRAAKVIPFKKE